MRGGRINESRRARGCARRAPPELSVACGAAGGGRGTSIVSSKAELTLAFLSSSESECAVDREHHLEKGLERSREGGGNFVLPEECGGEDRPRWVERHARMVRVAWRHAAGAPSLDGSTHRAAHTGCESLCCAAVTRTALRMRGAAAEEAAADRPSRTAATDQRGASGCAGRWQPREDDRHADARPPC